MENNINIKNLKIPYKFDSRYIFEDSLIRIFRLVSEVKQLEELIMNTKLPYIFSEGTSPTIFDYNLKEISAYDSYKEISWLLICKEIQTPIKILFNLAENTLDNTVLVVFEISIVKRELIPEKYKYKIITNFEGIAVDVLNNIIIKLKNDNKDIYHYESKIFNYSRDKIKNIIYNLNEIMKERGVISSIVREGEKNKEGEVISLILLEDQREIKIKINEIKVDENDFKWKISYMPLDFFYKDYLVEWNIIKIKNNQTLVAINNLYYEQIEPEIKKKLTDTKKNLFLIMEEELRKKYPKQ
jgi:hypothetical protein